MLLRQRLVCAAAPLAFSPLRSARFLPCAQVWRSFSSGEGESNGDGAGGRVRADLAPYFAPRHPANNVPESILGKVGRRLHLQKHHPLNIIKTRIEEYCQAHAQQHSFAFQIFDDLSPVVSTTACFDDLRVGPEHVSRLPSDTYYLDPHTVLRTHTSAHQTALMRQGVGAFLCCGDVYRRDEIDASHYPVFHQMEGVRVYTAEEVQALVLSDSGTNGTSNSTSNSISNSNGDNTLTSSTPHAVRRAIEAELKGLLTGLALHLFGDVQMRWRDDYFPFTEPSFELEIFFNGDWLEVLGCGVVHSEVLETAGLKGSHAWAFGLGLERLAMVLFGVSDIRLFWTHDKRFTSQFRDGEIRVFEPYSKYPPCWKDVSFWLPAQAQATEGQGVGQGVGAFHSNDVYEVIRDVAGDLVERVELFDSFTHAKTGRSSHAYRIHYRHMDRSLTNAEVDEVQMGVRHRLVEALAVELR